MVAVNPVGIKCQEARIAKALMSTRVLVFGNTQGNTDTIKYLTRLARAEQIPTIVTLGRFTRGDCMGVHGETSETYLDNYRALLQWEKEDSANRLWLSVLGKYDYMPDGDVTQELIENHVTFDGTTDTGVFFYHTSNLYFAHFGQALMRGLSAREVEPNPDFPTVLFFSHSYYMGLNRGDKPKCPGDEMVGPFQIGRIESRDAIPHYVHLPPHQRIRRLKPGEVYWVSTGGNFPQRKYPEFRAGDGEYNLQVMNFVVFDPIEQAVTFRTATEWRLNKRDEF
jgi:hypothetical protein